MNELNLEYKVIGNGKNVLVIETGIGGSMYDWFSIAQEVKEDFTIVLYHRAGYGKSKESNAPRTTRNIASELHNLLERIGIKDKLILMGHSFGGLCVQQYAKMYPNKLNGIILIDSTSFNFKRLYMLNNPVMNSLIAVNKLIEHNFNSSKKSRDELKKQNEGMISTYSKTIPEKEMIDVEDFFTNPVLYKTMAEEFNNWENDSEDIKSIPCFLEIPLIVIARDNKVAERYWIKYNIPEGEALLYEAEWRNLQIELSRLSVKGQLIIAENSDHEVYLDKPEIIVQCLKTLQVTI
jgi:pimeloyl-ACP methyl ester carboxylesterase